MTELISAREAMQAAQDAGDQGDYEAARFWLDFARELREEFFARMSYEVIWKPKPSMMPVPPADAAVTQQFDRPGETFEGDGRRCRHCGYFVKKIDAEGVGRDPGKSFYVHTRTDGIACPVTRQPAPGDTWVQTFAEPE